MNITEYFAPGQTDLYNRAKDLVEALSIREKQVLKLAAQGLEDYQIAINLGISVHTLRNHIARISSVAFEVTGRKMKFRNQIIPYISCFYFVHYD